MEITLDDWDAYWEGYLMVWCIRINTNASILFNTEKFED